MPRAAGDQVRCVDNVRATPPAVPQPFLFHYYSQKRCMRSTCISDHEETVSLCACVSMYVCV